MTAANFHGSLDVLPDAPYLARPLREKRLASRWEAGGSYQIRRFHEVLNIFSTISPEGQPMTETSAVDMRVRLPQPLAEEAERVRGRDPDALNRIVAYGVTRRAIFDHLVSLDGDLEPVAERRY